MVRKWDMQHDTVEHIADLMKNIEGFTIINLERYCKAEDDNLERLIYRASEIFIGRHPYEFNLILNQLVDDELATDKKAIEEYKKMWFEKGLSFD